jgi:hypothetical protein
MRGTVGPLWLAWLAAAGAAGGCSLFDQVGSGDLSFDLPVSRDFKIDSTDPRWWPSPPYGVPDVVCSGPAALVSNCCQPPPPMDAVDCQAYPLSCDDSGICALAFDYDDAVEIYLARDVPALQRRRHLVLVQATLATIDATEEVAEAGTLPVRYASLYVAPLGTTSAQAAGAVFLADIPSGPGTNHVDLAEDAQDALSAFLVDFNTPFVLILSGHVVIGSALVPKTALRISVTGRVDASF